MHRTMTALIGASALSLACGPVAFASDLAVKAPALKALAAAAPVSNWTGFYIGGTAGAAWTSADVTLDPVNGTPANYRPQDLPGIAALGSADLSATDVIFGGKLGYNYQFSAWVAGIEADFSYLHFDKSINVVGNPFPGFAAGTANFITRVSTNWLATVRPRVGYAFDRTLVYATGGVAFGRVSFSNTEREFSFNGFGFGNEASSASKTLTGWSAGGGVDYALTPNWIASIEYLHVDLGKINASGVVTSLNATTATLNFSTKVTSDIARGGIAYKF
jgi:outer membrane immunogenic protein